MTARDVAMGVLIAYAFAFTTFAVGLTLFVMAEVMGWWLVALAPGLIAAAVLSAPRKPCGKHMP